MPGLVNLTNDLREKLMKSFTKISCLFLLIILPFVLIYPQNQQYQFEQITTRQGLSPYVFSIFKDSKGFMWFLTGNGLYRYNGYGFRVFRNDPSDSTSISGSFLWSNVVEDEAGNLWIGSYANGLNRYNPETETFTRYKHDPDNPYSISSNNVRYIFPDQDGIFWIATWRGGLNKFNSATGKFTKFLVYPDNRQHPAIISFGSLPKKDSTASIRRLKNSPVSFMKLTIPAAWPITIWPGCGWMKQGGSGYALMGEWTS